MNNTKWRELQSAMYEIDGHSPKWRTKCIDSDYVSEWDGEWFYHFSEGGFKDIEWVEIQIENDLQSAVVKEILQHIHLPGVTTENGFKVFGYIKNGLAVDFI